MHFLRALFWIGFVSSLFSVIFFLFSAFSHLWLLLPFVGNILSTVLLVGILDTLYRKPKPPAASSLYFEKITKNYRF